MACCLLPAECSLLPKPNWQKYEVSVCISVKAVITHTHIWMYGIPAIGQENGHLGDEKYMTAGELAHNAH